MAAAEADDGICSVDRPEHTRLFEAGADDSFAPGFDHAGADEQVLASKLGIAHALDVSLKVSSFDSDGFRDGRCGNFDPLNEPDQLFDLAVVEFGPVAEHPWLLVRHVARVEKSGQFPEVLAGMKQIDDLNSAGKVLVCMVPDPFGSVSDDHLLLGAVPATIPGFQINSAAKLAGGFDAAGIGR